jgi:hypothetical protein
MKAERDRMAAGRKMLVAEEKYRCPIGDFC